MSGSEVTGVGLIGLGTVGGGVAQLLKEKADLYAKRSGRRIEVRGVLVRNVEKAQASGLVDPDLITDDADAFFGRDGVDVVAELAGGIEVAGGYVRRAIASGRHVVTANKALLAAEGAELFGLARQAGVAVGFEASCAGGIPCITALQYGLMANRVEGLMGILNGTCNYMLTEMKEAGKTYEQALADAQAEGYAEADPTLDVTGRDAADKLAILSSLAFGARVSSEQVASIGIDGLEAGDVKAGEAAGFDLKLLGVARPDASGALSLMVEPCYVPDRGVLAGVKGAFNALMIEGDAVGQVMLYGPGAGRGPTASAVVSDLLNVANGWAVGASVGMGLTPDVHGDVQVVAAGQRRGDFAVRASGSMTLAVHSDITAAEAERLAGSGRVTRVMLGV